MIMVVYLIQHKLSTVASQVARNLVLVKKQQC